MVPDPDANFFRPAREAMLADQLLSRHITSARVLHAMAAIPRHRFVPAALRAQAYDDCALPSADGQTISQPYIVALMTQLLDIQPAHRILEIGTGTGYQTAILATLADRGRIFTIERIAHLAVAAQELLTALGLTNISYHTGDGSLGWPPDEGTGDRGPGTDPAPSILSPLPPPPPSPLFDRILITAGTPDIPAPLLAQLAPGGLLVAPRGGPTEQRLITLTRIGSTLSDHRHIPCRFVPLIGAHGWKVPSP